MFNPFTAEILDSSGYSTDTPTCIHFIRSDLEKKLGPIADILEDDSHSRPEEAEELRSLFTTDEFARAIMSSVIPSGETSWDGEQIIAGKLREKLAPLVESLSERSLPSDKVAAIALLKQLYEIEQTGELATAEGVFSHISTR